MFCHNLTLSKKLYNLLKNMAFWTQLEIFAPKYIITGCIYMYAATLLRAFGILHEVVVATFRKLCSS